MNQQSSSLPRAPRPSAELRRWLQLLEVTDRDDVDALTALVRQMPIDLIRQLAHVGGPLIREKLMVPAMARAVDAGLIERTNEYDLQGLRVYRSKVCRSR